MANVKSMLSIERLNTPHALKYNWGLDKQNVDTGEAELVDWNDGVSLSEVVAQIDNFCPTINETKEAIIALMQNDEVVLHEDF